LGASNEDAVLNSLLEKKLISTAQVEVAKMDMSVTGLSAIDVLLTRKWITDEQATELQTLSATKSSAKNAPQASVDKSADKSNAVSGATTAAQSDGSKGVGNGGELLEKSKPQLGTNGDAANSSTSEQIYLENLKVYRKLMAEIMGEPG
jgi:hypothetical protein